MIPGFVWVVPMRVDVWKDGDTCQGVIDTGWGNHRPYTAVRLLRLYCAEVDGAGGEPEPGAVEALAYAITLVPPGTVIKLHSKKLGRSGRWSPSSQESLSRTLGDLELPDGSDFADLMVAGGCGSHANGPGTGRGLSDWL